MEKCILTMLKLGNLQSAHNILPLQDHSKTAKVHV